MDNSGNNRYELLFMDDDAPPQIPVAAVASAPPKKREPSAPKAPKSKPEKKNKPVGDAAAKKENNAVTKGVTKSGNPVKGGGKAGPPPRNAAAPAGNGERNNNQQRSSGGNRDAVNAGNAGKFGNELPQRQFNNRDNRGPARFRVGKREFDRQSGSDKTGVKSIDKREGGGARNWGSVKQDIKDQKTGESAPQAEKEDSANATTSAEDESKQMTLDEWKALSYQRVKPNWNLRKAGEGVDNPEWKKMVVLSKKKESNGEGELEYDPSLYPQRVGRLQRIVDIQFNFNDGRKPGGFRRGPRNAYERQDNNNRIGEKSRSGQEPLKVDDEAQFPTLS